MKNNEDIKNREKVEEKFDISISNHVIGFLNFLRFKAFKILGTFYEVKFIMYRSTQPKVSVKKGFPRNFTRFIRKHLYRNVFFNKVASLHPVALLKRILRHRCF